MNIRCIATREILDYQACLGCAAAGRNTCNYDYGLLKFIYRDQEKREGIHVTDLTGCLLRSWLHKTQPPIQFPHEQLMLALGSITHGLLEGGSNHIMTEAPLEALGIVGKADEIYVDRGRIVDYKTTRWLVPSRLPYGSHVLQVNIYALLNARMTGHEVRSLAIQYIDLSGPTKCRACKLPVIPEPNGLACPACHATPKDAHLGAVLLEVEVMDPEEIREQVIERRDKLLLALEMNDPPEAEPSFLCAYCAYLDGCTDGRAHTGRE